MMTDVQIKLASISRELLRTGKDHAEERALSEAIVAALENILANAGTTQESEAFAIARKALADWYD